MRRRGATRFLRDREGVSAVEFAFIAPILILMFTASIELPRAFMIGKRLDHAASTMVDLISGSDFADLKEVYGSATIVSNPYDVSTASIVLTAAGIYRTGGHLVARVCSSAARNAVARAAGSPLGAPPPGMGREGDRFVMAEVRMRYTALFPLFSGIFGRSYDYKTIRPVRGGTAVKGQPETVLPQGQPCPAK